MEECGGSTSSLKGCGTFQEPAGTGQAAEKPSHSGGVPISPVPETAGVRSGRVSTQDELEIWV